MSHALEAISLFAGYNGVPIVKGLDLQVDPGEVVVLLGRNGAGKTTTLLTLAGALPRISGDIRLNGAPAPRRMYQRIRRGLGLVTDDKGVFYTLTVAENLRLSGGAPEVVLEYFPELEVLMPRRVGLLSGGQQQMLALGRVLASRPQVILGDELSLGLAPIVTSRLMSAVRRAADDGAAVLMVEQHARAALRVADRGYVLRNGQVALSGTRSELEERMADVELAYLSGE